MSRISRKQAIEVSTWCREHQVRYTSSTTYPNTVAAAMNKNTLASNGMRIHYPREYAQAKHSGWANKRAYVLWHGEPLDMVIEALAFIKMTSSREELIVLRCRSAKEEEPKASLDDTVQDAIDAL